MDASMPSLPRISPERAVSERLTAKAAAWCATRRALVRELLGAREDEDLDARLSEPSGEWDPVDDEEGGDDDRLPH